jgi:phosphotransacetylase
MAAEPKESDEERIVKYIKKLIDERVSKEGVVLLDLRRANDVASELGLDLRSIKVIFDELNRMLDERFKGLLSEGSML